MNRRPFATASTIACLLGAKHAAITPMTQNIIAGNGQAIRYITDHCQIMFAKDATYKTRVITAAVRDTVTLFTRLFSRAPNTPAMDVIVRAGTPRQRKSRRAW